MSAIEAAVKMRRQLEIERKIVRYEDLKPTRPEIDEKIVGIDIEQL